MKPVEETWTEIKNWLSLNIPNAISNLNEPATDAEIEATEKAFDLEFPAGLKQLYRQNNGEKNNWPPGAFDDGHWFMPLNEVVQFRNTMKEFAVSDDTASHSGWKRQAEEGLISIKGPVKPLTYSQKWIPFTDSNGDVDRFIDFDPAPGGVAGQVVEIDQECGTYKVVASSIEEFLHNYLSGLNSGQFKVSADMIENQVQDNVLDWGLPEYLRAIEQTVVNDADISGPVDLKKVRSGESFELIGQIIYCVGRTDEQIITLRVHSGAEYSIVAIGEKTKGFGSVSIDDFIRVVVVSDLEPSELAKWAGAKPPQLFAIEYELVLAPGVELKRRAWWRFW